MGRGGKELASLTEKERRALRGSKFAPLPSQSSYSSSSSPHNNQQHKHPRLAHPGGPMTTNKAAALAKFLERKLQQPDGLSSINPELLELAVKNAKEAVTSGGTSGRIARHVNSFDDSSEEHEVEKTNGKCIASEPKSKKKNKNKKKKDGTGCLAPNSNEKKMKKKKKKIEVRFVTISTD